MRRGLLLLLTWLAGTVVATALAWGAVSVVRRNVTERRVAPLSARAVSEALDTTPELDTTSTSATDVSTATPPTTATTVSSGSTNPGGRTPTTRAGGVTTTTRRGTTGTTGSTGSGSTSPSGGSTTGAPSSSGTSSGGSSASQPAPAAQPQPQYSGERVVDDGNRNQVDIRCDGQTVSYGWITPASGWSYQVLANGPADLIVKFKRSNPNSESRLEASCDAAGHPTFTWKR